MTINIRFISAGAGSGKTYRLTEELEDALTKGRARPACVIGTTFTKKAARELRERVRRRLVENGWSDVANALEQALLGTVNSICDRLLRRFAFEIGLSPDLEVLPEEEAQLHFNMALESAITNRQIRLMNQLGDRLGISEWP